MASAVVVDARGRLLDRALAGLESGQVVELDLCETLWTTMVPDHAVTRRVVCADCGGAFLRELDTEVAKAQLRNGRHLASGCGWHRSTVEQWRPE